jgi:hypothetical protein
MTQAIKPQSPRPAYCVKQLRRTHAGVADRIDLTDWASFWSQQFCAAHGAQARNLFLSRRGKSRAWVGCWGQFGGGDLDFIVPRGQISRLTGAIRDNGRHLPSLVLCALHATIRVPCGRFRLDGPGAGGREYFFFIDDDAMDSLWHWMDGIRPSLTAAQLDETTPQVRKAPSGRRL